MFGSVGRTPVKKLPGTTSIVNHPAARTIKTEGKSLDSNGPIPTSNKTPPERQGCGLSGLQTPCIDASLSTIDEDGSSIASGEQSFGEEKKEDDQPIIFSSWRENYVIRQITAEEYAIVEEIESLEQKVKALSQLKESEESEENKVRQDEEIRVLHEKIRALYSKMSEMRTEARAAKRYETPVDSSISLNTILNVWQSIEPLLCVKDTVSVSRTCKSLHEAIVDAETGKIKVSAFTEIPDEQYATRLPFALNAIHFPSLRRLRYPPLRRLGAPSDHDRIDGGASCHCFHIFVANLQHASNLESLTFNAQFLVLAEYKHARGFAFAVSPNSLVISFGQYIRECTKLRELCVSNCNFFDDASDAGRGSFFHSTDLLTALTPTIVDRKDDLDVLSVTVKGESLHGAVPKSGCPIARSFFSAIFDTTNVTSLYIEVEHSSTVARSLCMAAVGRNEDNFHRLRSLDLYIVLDIMDELGMINYPLDLYALVALFSNCNSLCDAMFTIPSVFWDDECQSLHTFKQLFSNKPKLKSLVWDFNHYMDTDGRVIDLLYSFAIDCNKDIWISSLSDVNVLQLRELVNLYETAGVDCVHGDDDDLVDIHTFEEDTIYVNDLSLRKYTKPLDELSLNPVCSTESLASASIESDLGASESC